MQAYFKPQIARSIKRAAPKQAFALTEKQLEVCKNVGDIVLGLAAVAGTMALTVLAPNIFQILDKLPWAKKTYRHRDTKQRDQQRKITQAFYYLKQQGYVELVPAGDDFQVRIVKKGRKKIRQMQFRAMQVGHSGKWDRHWWIVLADIPSKDNRRQADYFREKLKAMKFYPLQRTVWVYPFDPRDEVDFAAAYYRIERFVTMMEVLTLDAEDEQVLKRFFREKKVL